MESLRDRLSLGGPLRALGPPVAAAAGLAVLTFSILTLPVPAQLALVASFIAVSATFIRPTLMLLGYFLLRILMDLLWWVPGRIGSLNVMEAYTGGVTVLVAAVLLLEFRRVERHPCLPAFLPYVAVLAIGGLRNLEVRSAAEIMARYVSPFIIMFLVSGLMNTRAWRRRFIVATTAVFAIPVVLSLFYLAQGQMTGHVLAGYHRLRGGYMNLHTHALSMVIIAALAAWWALQTQDRAKRTGFALFAGAAALCLYLTYVRTGIITLAVLVSVYLWVTGRRRLLLAGVLAGGVFILFSPSMQDRFKDIILFFMPDQAVMARRKIGSGRWGIWSSAMAEYLRQPLADIILGLGIGKHWLLTRAAFNPYSMASHGYVDAHSDYLTMTFQVGPIATGSYLLMQATAIRAGLAVYRNSPDKTSRQFAAFTIALMAGATAANMVSNAYINRITQSWVVWGLSGLTFAEYLQLQREGLLSRKAKRRRGPLRSAPRGSAGTGPPQLAPQVAPSPVTVEPG